MENHLQMPNVMPNQTTIRNSATKFVDGLELCNTTDFIHCTMCNIAIWWRKTIGKASICCTSHQVHSVCGRKKDEKANGEGGRRQEATEKDKTEERRRDENIGYM